MVKNAQPASELMVFQLTNTNFKVFVSKPLTYDDAIKAACVEFEFGPDREVVFLVNKSEITGQDSNDDFIEVTSRSWGPVMKALAEKTPTFVVRLDLCDSDSDSESECDNKNVKTEDAAPVRSAGPTRTLHDRSSSRTQPYKTPANKTPAKPSDSSLPASPRPVPVATAVSDCHTLYIKTLYGRVFQVRNFDSNDTLNTIKSRIMDLGGPPPDDHRLLYAGKQLDDNRTLSDYNIGKEATIHSIGRLRGGKPVIYLFAPSSTSASVTLRLVPEWSFSCVYPAVDIVPFAGGKGQAIKWDVDVTGPNGLLVNKQTGDEEAYLFWEALSNPTAVDTPPASPTLSAAFNPARPIIKPHNSVVLAVADVPAYLQTALKAICLHVEARTSFITYWLPHIQAHTHIALRFLPQDEYERAAPLDVTPAPDVVTRVFMLFRGLSAQDAEAWHAQAEPHVWKDVVGVDAERALDGNLFRVLEWGGMEVK